MKTLLYRLTLVIFAASYSASAGPIVFTHESLGSGTLDGVPFFARTFTIVATGDTTNRQSPVNDGVFFTDHISATIEIAGLGTFEIFSPTRTFVNQRSAVAGFSRAGSTGADLLNGPTDDLFASWDMLSSIGPLVGEGSLLQWENESVTTSAGILAFDSQPAMVRFTATTGTDSDGDGVTDDRDLCPGTGPRAVANADGCSITQLVPCAGPVTGGTWKNHGQYVFAFVRAARSFQQGGLITREVQRAWVRSAAQSDCGKNP